MKDDASAYGSARERRLELLRQRMVQLARRRVAPDDVEDVVQAALQIVIEKGAATGTAVVDGLPPLAWCFQVLRNTVGNHYKRRRTERLRLVDGTDLAQLPAAAAQALDPEDQVRALEKALDDIADQDPQCGELLRGVVDGRSANELAMERRLAAHALYQRLYRCRRRLREMLRRRGILA